MTDTHAHIYSKKFENNIESILVEAFEQQVSRIYMPNIDHQSIDNMLAVEEKYPKNCFAMIGLHPCSVKKYFEKELYIVENWLSKRKFFAIGEMGVDLYWDKTFFEQQQEAFRIQAEWAKKYRLPIVVHSRNAMQQVIELLEELNDENLTGIVHCFTGTLQDAEKIIALKGFKLGIGGVATFKHGGLEQVLAHVDMKHLVLETDSPYLAPVPYRGKINKPAYIPIIAKRVANIKNITVSEVSNITDKNASYIYGTSQS